MTLIAEPVSMSVEIKLRYTARPDNRLWWNAHSDKVKKITMAVVVEPSTIYVSRGGSNYSCIKLYLNGEEVGCIGYISNSGAILNSKTITFDGTEGDLYLYYVLAYNSHYEWAQAFRNYLCKLTDTSAMIQEYEAENVLDTQNRPTIEALSAKGIPYYVVVSDQQTFDTFDGDIDTSKKFKCTLFYYHPTMRGEVLRLSMCNGAGREPLRQNGLSRTTVSIFKRMMAGR